MSCPRRWLVRIMLCVMAWLPLAAGAQVTQGLYNWIRSTRDAEAAFAFYEQVFGFALAYSTFAGPPAADAAPPSILPAAEARSDALVWDLTNTHGSRFRTVFMHATNLAWGLELSEFFAIARDDRQGNAWDPGNSMLVISVRDLAATVQALQTFGAPMVSPGSGPVATPAGAAVLVRDPDGYLVQVMQASPGAIAGASEGVVIDAAIRLTVSDTAASLAYYRDLLGFTWLDEYQADASELALMGLAAGAMTNIVLAIPGSGTRVILSAFTLPDGIQARPFQWQLQDVGAPQFQLQVSGLDDLLVATRQGGYRFLSVDGKPIQRAFGRFVFAIDPDGVLVEYVEPAAP